MVGGSDYASNKQGDNVTLQKWSVSNKCGIYNSKKYGLKDMQHKIPTCMWSQNNRKLSGFFYSNLIISSSVFRPLDIINSFANEYCVACQQGTLTLPDTWFRPPFWDLLMLQLLRPNSSTLPCLYSTFHLEYPLVLSRFCLLMNT